MPDPQPPNLTPTADPHPPHNKPITIKHPQFTYLHLTLLTTSTSNPHPPDLLTARTHLTSALHQYLGMSGTAIPIDFLQSRDRDVWIRVPREDGAAVVGAVSQWMGKDGAVGWRVRGRGEWLGALAAGDGRDLFELGGGC